DRLALGGVRLRGHLRGSTDGPERKAETRGAGKMRPLSGHAATPLGIAVESRDFIRISAFRHRLPLNPIQQSPFLLSAANVADFPPEAGPELAFAGRSNVGKSSAINSLAGRRRLAFSSKTPGRTQTINFFVLGDAGRLADLPGYGY